MVDAAQAIYAQLNSSAPLLALVNTGGGIKPLHQFQGTRAYPAVVYWDNEAQDVDRTYTGSTGLIESEIVISCFARSYAQAKQMYALVYALFENQGGAWGGVVVNGTFVRPASEVTIESAIVAEEDTVYVQEMRLQVWYRNV